MPAATRLGVHMSLRRSQPDASASGLDIHRTSQVAEIEAAAARGSFDLAGALPYFNAAATGLDNRVLRAGIDSHTAAASFRGDFAVGMVNLDRTTAGVQSQFARNRADFDRAAPGLGTHAPTDVIQTHTAAAGLRFHAACETGGFDVATIGFEFDQRHLTRHVDVEFSGKMSRMSSTLPISYDPGSVSFYVSGDFILLELVARFLLR